MASGEVVVVGNHETLHHSQIRKELSQLLKWYKKIGTNFILWI
jgi:hypothetical protein